MDFRDLTCFVAVAEERHFTRAAERLGMSQPPLTQRIKKLEEEIGYPLFDRTSRSVRTTAAGLALLRYAHDMLMRREDALLAARRAATGDVEDLRLGAGASASAGLLPLIVKPFRAEGPSLRLIIEECEIDEAYRGLNTGRFDLIFARGPVTFPGMKVEELVREELVAVVPSGDPLTSSPGLRPDDLAAQKFILFPRRSAPVLFDTIITLCTDAGFSPDIVEEATSWATMCALIAANEGVTIVPRSARLIGFHGVTLCRLWPHHQRASFVAAYRDETINAAGRRFLHHAGNLMAMLADHPSY